MTQKEIWTGYWNTFWKGCLNVLVPFAMVHALSEAIGSVFRRKRPTLIDYQAPPPPRKKSPLEVPGLQEEIKKILNEMQNGTKKHI